MTQFELSDNEHGGDANTSGNDSIPLSRLVNLSLDHTHSSSILPGPFVVLQGSPGDGMANTVDSMPMPPPSSPSAITAAVGRNSAMASVQDRIPDRVLEELDSDVSDESGEQEQEEEITETRPSSNPPADDSKQPAANLKPCAANRRPRSDSDTEGGLHLPLGASSPIMRNAHRGAAAALTNNFLSNGYNNNSSSPVRTRELFQEGDAVAASSMALPLDNDNDEGALFLKRRSKSAGTNSTSSSSQEGSNRRNITSLNDDGNGITNGEETTSKEQQNDDFHSNKTPDEIQAIHQWQQECQQQELTHLEESNQNVKLLLQRRKRGREQQLQRERLVQQQLNGVGSRSASPVGTATSASSTSSDSVSLPQPTNVTTTASANIAATGKEKEDDPINEILHTLELANNHRSWYQKDGQLVVFKSLPHMSLQGVVAHPITTKSPSDDATDNGVMTLAPGCTVMAESAYILDSRTLRQLYPRSHSNPSKNSNSNDSSNDSNCPKLVFLKITSPHNGYILSTIHSYPLLLPGLPTTYTNADHWLWRVTCQPDGAYIRRGLELVTEHIGTLPYGTVCSVNRKVVNGMGLNRLKIEAYLSKDVDVGGSSRIGEAITDAFGMTNYSGYISEFLNPLSGQRGNVVEPLPFPVPALYKVVHSRGCIIRSGVDLSTTQIGFAPPNSILSIVGRSYSDHPGHNCIERLKLAGGGGWISVSLNRRPPGNEVLVTMVGVDGSFDPKDPARFHFESVRRVMEELHADNSNNHSGGGNAGASIGSRRIVGSAEEARIAFRRFSSYADLSEIGDDDAMEQQQQQQHSSFSIRDNNKGTVPSAASPLSISPRNTTTAVPTLFRSGVVDSTSSCGILASSMDAIRESSSDDHHHNSNPNRCLICLSDERTATIVHGETGHIACCLTCARILKARGDNCPVCRLPIDLVIQQFWA